MNDKHNEKDNDQDGNAEIRRCEKCGVKTTCEMIPMHGFPLWLCRKCAAAAYHSGEAV